MTELTGFLDLIVKYGLPLIISGLAIGMVWDIYQSLKKNWVPAFLKSFQDISDNVKGLNESLHILTEQTPIMEEIRSDVKILLTKQA